MKDRDAEVALIKKLICGQQTLCPKCEGAYLQHFHKKAKKSNMQYICPSCQQRYQVTKMMAKIN